MQKRIANKVLGPTQAGNGGSGGGGNVAWRPSPAAGAAAVLAAAVAAAAAAGAAVAQPNARQSATILAHTHARRCWQRLLPIHASLSFKKHAPRCWRRGRRWTHRAEWSHGGRPRGATPSSVAAPCPACWRRRSWEEGGGRVAGRWRRGAGAGLVCRSRQASAAVPHGEPAVPDTSSSTRHSRGVRLVDIVAAGWRGSWGGEGT